MTRPTPDILADLGQSGDDGLAAAMGPQARWLAGHMLRMDGGTQPRAEISDDLVFEYRDAMAGGAQFPPVVVFFDGTDYWLADGFHRVHAADALGRDVLVDVRQGTRREAVLFSVSANATHGLRRTNADKRRAVLALLQDDEWQQWSDREIARRCAVSDRFVNTLRAELSANGSQMETRRVVRGGTEYTMTPAQRGAAPAVAGQGGNYATADELDAAVRAWLGCYDTREEREAALTEVIEMGEDCVTFDDLREWINVKPRRGAELVQAAGRVLIELRLGAAPRPADTVLPQEQPAVLSAQRKAEDRERQARERQYARKGAAETLTVYATEHRYTGVLRWVAYHLTTAQFDDLINMTERELWYEISLVLVDAMLNREPTASISRLRKIIDERFEDLRLTPPLWPEDDL